MLRRMICSIPMLVLWVAVSAPIVPAQQSSEPLTNDDVIKMVKSGLQESTILGAIQANPTNFDDSTDALIALQQSGVSQKIMDAMLAAQTNQQGKPAGTS